MKVYLAAPYGSRETIRRYAGELRDLGIDVTSSWLEETHAITAGTQGAATALSDEQVAEHARTDLLDVRSAGTLVLFTAASVGVEGGGGRHVETGYALALHLDVLVVGEPENVFHRLQRVQRVADWPAARDALVQRLAAHLGVRP